MKKQNTILKNPIIKMVAKILSWVLLVSLVLIAGLLIYNIVSSKLYEIRGQKYEPEIALYTIISPSMEPNINVYDVVVTQKIKDFSQIKEGDVITFVSTSTLGEGLTVTHRVKEVIKTEDDIKFRTQGDNNPIADSALASSKNVMGKVMFKIPWVGHIQFFLQSKGGWLFALLIPAMIIVVYDVYKVIRLSNIKQKVNDSIKEKEEDEELKEKKDRLKKDLHEKYDNKEESHNKFFNNDFNDKSADEEKEIKSNNNKKEEQILDSNIEKESNKDKKEKESYIETSEPEKVEKVEKIKENKNKEESYIETSKPTKVSKVENNENIDISKVLKNINKLEKDEKKYNIENIMSNIAMLDNNDDELDLPKKR